MTEISKTKTMILSLPEGGQATMTWPEHVTPESVEMMAECLALQVKVIRRSAEQRKESSATAADLEYASWLPRADQ